MVPFAKVEVPDVTLRRVVERPPAKVEVPCPAPTVMAAAKVEVAVVEVATKLLASTSDVKRALPVTSKL